jgi:hypothetical protein
VRLRPAWKEAKRAGRSRASADARTSASAKAPAGGEAPVGGKAPASGKAAGGAKASGGAGAGGASAKAPPLPSRTRVLANVIVGLVVTAASLATLIARG